MFGAKSIITAVEMGTSKICVLMGRLDEKGNINIIGHGEKNSDGAIIKGEISNMEKTTDLLFDTIHAAENSSGESLDVENTYVAVTGSHVRGSIGTGSVVVTGEERKITPENIDEVTRTAAHIPMPSEYTVLNSIFGNYLLDGIRRTQNPENQVANRLEVSSFTISGNKNCVETYRIPLREFGCENPEPVFSGLATAICVITDDEMKHGVLLVDIGAGTTEYMMFHESCGCSCGVIPVGCDHIANDLAIGLDLNVAYCRKMLNENIAHANKLQGIDHILLEGTMEKRKIPINSLDKIIELRLSELFKFIHGHLENEKVLKFINRGIVVTGGGSLLQETKGIANSVFDCLVRTGLPPNLSGAVSNLKSPRYSMITGLIAAGESIKRLKMNSKEGPIRRIDRVFQRTWNKLRRSAKDAFPF